MHRSPAFIAPVSLPAALLPFPIASRLPGSPDGRVSILIRRYILAIAIAIAILPIIIIVILVAHTDRPPLHIARHPRRSIRLLARLAQRVVENPVLIGAMPLGASLAADAGFDLGLGLAPDVVLHRLRQRWLGSGGSGGGSGGRGGFATPADEVVGPGVREGFFLFVEDLLLPRGFVYGVDVTRGFLLERWES